MLSRPEQNALLLITHPGGARSFDYEDRWEGDTLVYTGRGKKGDQRLEGPNRDVAENRKRLLVLEAVASRQLRYLGEATCVDSWPARSPDSEGHERNVWKFRLRFDRPPVVAATATSTANEPRTVLRRPRSFVPGLPAPRETAGRRTRTTPEETAVLQEKASREHCRLLVRLDEVLRGSSWKNVPEIPAAVDLWATSPEGHRILFEAKTLSGLNDVHQSRAAIAQLLEYGLFYAEEADRLCGVFNGPIADRRRVLLESLGIAILCIDENGEVSAVGQVAQSWFGRTALAGGPVTKTETSAGNALASN